MQKKLFLNALVVVALLTFPAAAFGSSPSDVQTSGNDMQAELTLVPSDSAIESGDTIELHLEIKNLGPENAYYDHNSNLPIGELFVPPTIDIDSIEAPAGHECYPVPIADVGGPVVAARLPGYVLVMCTLSEGTTDFTLAPNESVTIVLYGTANADVENNTEFLSVALSDEDPSFIEMYTAIMNGEDPFAIIEPGDNYISQINYVVPQEPNTIVTDISIAGTLNPSSTVIHSGDEVSLTYVIHNAGPDNLIDTDGNKLFFELFVPPAFTVNIDPNTHIAANISGFDGMVCIGGLVHDFMPNSTVDITYPGYSVLLCNTPVAPGFTIPSGQSVTLTVHGTASADFVDGVTNFHAAVVAGSDPDVDALTAAFMNNQNPLLVDNNNVAHITYNFEAAPAVLAKEKINVNGSVSGTLSSTGARIVSLVAIAIVLLGFGIAMVVTARKKDSENIGQ